MILLSGCEIKVDIRDIRSKTINIFPEFPIASNLLQYHLTASCKKCDGGYLYKIGPKETLNCDSSDGATPSSSVINIDLTSVPDGNIKLCLWGYYKKGVVLDNLAVFEWIKDTVAPSLSGSLLEGDGYYSSTSRSPVINWPAATDELSGVDHYEVAMGTSPGATDTLSWLDLGNILFYYQENILLASGQTYYASIRAIDKAGNISTPLNGTGWYVDPSVPLSISTFNDMNFGSSSETPLMEWSQGQDLESGVDHYQMALGTAPGLTDILNFTNVIYPNSSTDLIGKLTGLNLNNGQIYYPSIRAVDKASNPSTATQGNGFRAVNQWKNLNANSNSFINGEIKKIAIQPDGKRILAGAFNMVGGTPVPGVFQLDSAGAQDTTMNFGTGFNSNLYDMARQTDGKIIFVGGFTTYQDVPQGRIARLNVDGSIDSTFSTGSGFDASAFAIAIQPNGKILVIGYFTSYNGTNAPGLARLNSDGSIDTTFNCGSGFDQLVSAKILVQTDGKIIIGGFFNSFNGAGQGRFLRLNSDGTLDSAFMSNVGTGFDNAVKSLDLQSDGKILLAGYFSSYNGTSKSAVARINGDGTIDSTFTAVISGGSFVLMDVVKAQSDGKIIIGGSAIIYSPFGFKNVLTRVNANGSADGTFSSSIGLTGSVYSIAQQPDAKILLSGSFTLYAGSTNSKITRINVDGTNDSSFNPGTGPNNTISAMLLEPTWGKILVVGQFTAVNGSVINNIVRVNIDDSIDTSFSTGSGFDGTVIEALLQSDGKVLLTGGFAKYNGSSVSPLVRLSSDGTLDSSINVGSTFPSGINSIVLQNDGKILVAGLNTGSYKIKRYNSDGSIDNSFSVGSGFDNVITRMVIQIDGKILVGGSFTTYLGAPQSRLVRLNSDGSKDSTFDTGSGFDNVIYSMVIQVDGKILVGGRFTLVNGSSAVGLVRLNSNGSVDSNFFIGTGFVNGAVYSIVTQSDGKIILGGSFVSYNNTSAISLLRLNSNGTIDTTFNLGAGFYSAAVNTIEVNSEGKIIIGGFFTSFDNKPSSNELILGW